jgi:sensor domain CHASE-containing protein
MMMLLIVVALVVLAAIVLKSYATVPRILSMRELTQDKADPKEAVALTRRVVGF